MLRGKKPQQISLASARFIEQMFFYKTEDLFHLNEPTEHASQRTNRLTARQIAEKPPARAPIGNYVWRRTSEVELDFPLASISGRVGRCCVYYRRYGKQLVRRCTLPPDPRTDRQLEQRRRMTEVAREWHQLSPAQRQGWQHYTALQWLKQDGGNPVARSGQNLFTSAQLKRLAWGAPIRHEAPQQPPPGSAFALMI